MSLELHARYEARQFGQPRAWYETPGLLLGPFAERWMLNEPTVMSCSSAAEIYSTMRESLRSWGFRPAAPEVATSRGADFESALKDLEEADDEAREEGHAPPAELARKNARRLLYLMYWLRPCRYEVYPTRDREMCIYVPEGGRSVLVTCDPDGGVHCSTSLEQGHSRTYYDRDYAADPPPGFLKEALATLDVA